MSYGTVGMVYVSYFSVIVLFLVIQSLRKQINELRKITEHQKIEIENIRHHLASAVEASPSVPMQDVNPEEQSQTDETRRDN